MEVSAGIFQIKLPVPFPVKYVSCYLVKGSSGWGMVDTGLNSPEAQETWLQAIKKMNIHPRQITDIFLTHYHSDHYGLAGWWQGLSGARVHMLDIDAQLAQKFWNDTEQVTELVEFFNKHGMPGDISREAAEFVLFVQPLVRPHPTLIYLRQGQIVSVGDLSCQVIRSPGHSEGHICIYVPERRILFAGDHLLKGITPNVSKWPGIDGNPLGDYLDSLKELSQLDIELVLPAHGPIYREAQRRMQELVEGHTARIRQVIAALDGTNTAYDIAIKVFGERSTVHDQRYALTTVLAYLEYIVSSGQAKSFSRGEMIYWTR
ncbi:MAG: MBL fold metallo-hydrolase [Bacillota bacterium]